MPWRPSRPRTPLPPRAQPPPEEEEERSNPEVAEAVDAADLEVVAEDPGAEEAEGEACPLAPWEEEEAADPEGDSWAEVNEA